MSLSSRPLYSALAALLSAGTAAGASTLELSNPSPKQGQALEIYWHDSDDSRQNSGDNTVSFNGEKYRLFPYEPAARSSTSSSAGTENDTNTNINTNVNSSAGTSGKSYRALIGIPVTLKPGSYAVTSGGISKKITVVDAKYPVQHLSLPKSKDNFLTSPGEEAAVDAAKATVSDERFFKCPFIEPSKFRKSAAFGLRRVVNGKLLDDYFHSGLDFAAPQGTPIVATAAGKVILAHNGWRLHGNIVAIDHGQGVVSFYLHMQKILVKEGQEVAAGERIGLVGQTGRASGPHLHFSIYTNKVATDPKQWFAAKF